MYLIIIIFNNYMLFNCAFKLIILYVVFICLMIKIISTKEGEQSNLKYDQIGYKNVLYIVNN